MSTVIITYLDCLKTNAKNSIKLIKANLVGTSTGIIAEPRSTSSEI